MYSSTAIARAVSYPSLGKLLGAYDQLAVEVSTDQVEASVGPVSLHVYLAHSGDGIVWALKQPTPLTNTDAVSLTGRTYLNIGYDRGLAPSMGIVRLELTLQANAGPVRARVRVHVTANNMREREFSAMVDNAQRQGPGVDVYDRCYPGGSSISRSKVWDLMGYWAYAYNYRPELLSQSVIVPRDHMVCFNAYNDYILVDRGKVVWSSRLYKQQTTAPHHGPPRTAEDPKPKTATIEYEK
jgi:hypothetical protein